MNSLTLDDVRNYVEQNIGNFHQRRLESLKQLQLNRLISRKNPYLFRAKNISIASDLVRTILDAYLSSQEEGIFGDFLEGLAIFVNSKTFGGLKSSTAGIDLEFERQGVRYIVSIKSGPNWANSRQRKEMRDAFTAAKRTLGTSGSKVNVVAVEGCCYGRDNNPNKGDYFRFCGQRFWEFISGNEDIYLEIVEPLGHRAKFRNDAFQLEYARVLNEFTEEFSIQFCTSGLIDWNRLVAFNSSIEKPTIKTIKKIK